LFLLFITWIEVAHHLKKRMQTFLQPPPLPLQFLQRIYPSVGDSTPLPISNQPHCELSMYIVIPH
ncbi:hypothetical protein LSAT2_018857, partial [Lamellibrachia satsuma]